MSHQSDMLRAAWLAVSASGGTIRISARTLEAYPGDKHVWLTTRRDDASGDFIIEAHAETSS